MTKPISVGIIGAGHNGKKLVQEYLASERHKHNVKLVKVCDSSLAALLACEKEFSISYRLLTQKVEDIVKEPNISAVHIATPNQTHYPLAKMALEAGKHVLIENPITSDSRHAQELVELAASRELVLQVGHIFRFNSALRTAHQAIQSGMIGKVFYARVHWADDSPLFPDSDIIFGLGSHPIDVLNLLLDAWPSQASGFARAYRDSSDHGEVAFVTAQFPDAILAQIELSWLDPSKLREVSIVGSDGALVVDCLNQQVCQHRNGDSSELPVSGNNMIESEIDHFMDCIDRRITSPESGLIDVRTVQVLEAISESMLGQPLSTEQPANHTAAITEILEIASGAKRNSVWNIENGNAAFARYAGMLVRSGFLRPATAQEGKSYEITEAGAQFLREYRNIERDLDNLAERTRSDRYGSPAPRQRGRSDSAEF